MADTKFTGLSAQTTPLSADIFPFITDPGGTPTPKKVTFANIEASLTVANQIGGTASGTGNIVRVSNATLVAPVLGAATATTINKVTLTTPSSGSTLTIIDGKTLTVNKTMSLTAADDTGAYTFPTGTKTLLATDGAGTSLSGIPYTITGTANQVVASAGTGNITLSLPQSIATSSNPQFATIELGAASDTTIARSGAGAITVEGVQVILSGAALGTPASGTLTNCTALPVAGITASTSTALGVGSIELGHATDTSITRVSAGLVAIEGSNIMTVGSADTVTGVKTITSIVLPDQGQIKFTVPTTDLKATGPTCGDFNCGYSSSAIGDLVYLDSSGTWQKADATTSATTKQGFLAIALEVKASANALLVALPGSFIYSTTGFPTWTIGSPIYMSTAGAMTHTQPGSTDNAIRVVGWGVHADKMYFNPSADYITHT